MGSLWGAMIITLLFLAMIAAVLGSTVLLVVEKLLNTKIAVATALATVFLVFYVRFFNPMHDLKLWQFRHQFNQLSHPGDSIRVASDSRLGLLLGCSNHCDFFTGQIRWTQLSLTEVESFYASYTVPAVYPGHMNMAGFIYTDVSVKVIPIEGPEIKGDESFCSIPYEVCELSGWRGNISKYQEKKGTLYVVYVMDSGYAPFWDLRCH